MTDADFDAEIVETALKHARTAIADQCVVVDGSLKPVAEHYASRPWQVLARGVLALQQSLDQLVGPTTYCTSCGNEIDEDWCHCGEAIKGHGYGVGGHGPVPMGCTCGYYQPDLVQLSKTLRERWREARAEIARLKASTAERTCGCGALGPNPRTRHAPTCQLFDRAVDEVVAENDELRADLARVTKERDGTYADAAEVRLDLARATNERDALYGDVLAMGAALAEMKTRLAEFTASAGGAKP